MLDAIPEKLRAGDTWKWRSAAADYPASDGWSLVTMFRGPESIDQAGVADGDGWITTVPATATKVGAGRYSWTSRASKDDEVFTVASGVLEVLPDLTFVEGMDYDGRSSAEKQLAACEAALEGLLTQTKSTVTFGDQSYTNADVEKLMNIRDRLREEVAIEKRKANGGQGRRVLIQFTGL